MEKRKELSRLTYAQMRDLLEHDNMHASGLINDNLAVLKQATSSLVNQFMDEPFVVDEPRIIYVIKGEASPTVNFTQRHARAGDLCFIAGGCIVEQINTTPDFESKGLSCTSEFAALAFDGHLPPIFYDENKGMVMHLDAEESNYFLQLHDVLWQAIHHANYNASMVVHLVASIILYVNGLYLRQSTERAPNVSREQLLFNRFLQLVNDNAAQQHGIEFYASKLCLTPRYMSTIVKKVSGKGAKEWIDKALLSSIQIALRHTDKTASQIAAELNFPTTSFFCKYFKRLTGMTPLAYRNQ